MNELESTALRRTRSNTERPNARRNGNVPAVVGGILVALVIGFFVGRQTAPHSSGTGGGADSPAPAPSVPSSTPAPAGPANPAPAPPTANPGLSTADLAKAKNVPAVLPDPAGNYTLVAVIEGVDANRTLTQNLQVIGVQRQRLLALSQEFDRLPANSLQQRELIAGQINEARQTLSRNLQFMAKNYSYSLQFNYRLVPHAATLLHITQDAEGKPASEIAHRFVNAASYEQFQAKREEFLLRSVTEAREAEADHSDPSEPSEPSEPSDPSRELSPELKSLQQELITAFNYDPVQNYQVNLEKTALYARPGPTR